ncbi:sugar ABC transporter substrate-binding protein [Paenibacillus dakarensis]|uniref:sugar ABC transporter substrate-binding protein n=1 Tax=Paenibacillus dakarensis TaxID=1527293 RepID=UPI0006D5AA18|nr:maltose ABC transporter substrate-binding protein [Paenibacillus dakarensis]
MRLKKTLAITAAFTMMLSIAGCGGEQAVPEQKPPVSGNQEPGAKTPPPPQTDLQTGAKTPPPPQTGEPNGAKTAPPPETNGPEFSVEAGARLVVWEIKGEQVFSDEFMKQFTNTYGVEITREEVDSAEQAKRLSQGEASAADVVMLRSSELGKAAEAGLVLPNDLFEVEVRRMNANYSIQGVSYKEVLYGYPLAAETYVLYYNKSLIREAPETFEEVLEFSGKFTDKPNNKYGILWEAGNLYYSYPFLASAGGYIYGKNGTDRNDIGLNNAEARESMEIFTRMKNEIPVKTKQLTKNFRRDLFTSGKLAMDISGPEMLGDYEKALGDQLGAAPIPVIGKYPAVSLANVKAWYVNAGSKYPNAARMFAYYASTKDAQLEYSKQTGAVPTNLEAQQSDQVRNDPYMSAFTKQLDNASPVPTLPETDHVWGPVNAALTDIWDDNKDTKTALDRAVKKIQELNEL